MKLERIQTVQRLPIQIEEAWDFFTSPKNLRLITPHWLDYRLNIEPPEYLHPGTIISASIRPFPILSTDWISEITHIRPTQFYITEQRFGPFKMWHHEHHFRPHDDGVEIEDIIMYGMHFGMVGSLFHNVFIRSRLHEVFSFRAQALEQRFGSISKPRPKEQPQLSLKIPPHLQKQQAQRRPAQQNSGLQQNPVVQQKRPQTPGARPQPPQKRPPNQPAPGQKPGQKPGDSPQQQVPKQVTLDDIFGKTDD